MYEEKIPPKDVVHMASAGLWHPNDQRQNARSPNFLRPNVQHPNVRCANGSAQAAAPKRTKPDRVTITIITNWKNWGESSVPLKDLHVHERGYVCSDGRKTVNLQ